MKARLQFARTDDSILLGDLTINKLRLKSDPTTEQVGTLDVGATLENAEMGEYYLNCPLVTEEASVDVQVTGAASRWAIGLFKDIPSLQDIINGGINVVNSFLVYKWNKDWGCPDAGGINSSSPIPDSRVVSIQLIPEDDLSINSRVLFHPAETPFAWLADQGNGTGGPPLFADLVGKQQRLYIEVESGGGEVFPEMSLFYGYSGHNFIIHLPELAIGQGIWGYVGVDGYIIAMDGHNQQARKNAAKARVSDMFDAGMAHEVTVLAAKAAAETVQGYIEAQTVGGLGAVATTEYLANVPAGGGDGTTAQQVWEYGTRTLTSDSGSGTGASHDTITVVDDLGNFVADCEVWVTSDLDGTTIIAGPLVTNDDGKVEFLLDVGVTYYCWRRKAGVNFTNPATFVATGD